MLRPLYTSLHVSLSLRRERRRPCRSNLIIDRYQKCGCLNPLEWLARSVLLSDNQTIIDAPLCQINNYCYLFAANQLTNSSDDWDQFCSHCTRSCFTADYIVTPSAAMTTSDFQAYFMKIFVEATGVPLPANWTTQWPTHVQKNYFAVEVIQQTVLVENYSQEASVTAVDVLSNVGGHTGLWIGISFLSIMEFVEMLYRLGRLQFHIFMDNIRGRR